MAISKETRKRNKTMVGTIVRLVRSIHTKGGQWYLVGERFRITRTFNGHFDLVGVDVHGNAETNADDGCISRYIRRVSYYDFREDV